MWRVSQPAWPEGHPVKGRQYLQCALDNHKQKVWIQRQQEC
ncbi:MAG: hypothetical protein RIR68_3274 [Pseudomonadota bacterium]|jgi:hypothetical protein